jgi:hypothetical protein
MTDTVTDTTTTSTTRRFGATAIAGLLAIGSLVGAAACSDEDGDGGTTDEEIQDIDEGVDEAESQVEEEVDAQSEGSDEG